MKKAAFTLIELLVVITVIAILAGIALPVYGKVLEKSRATTDGSNLKQLGLGIAAYLNDNDEQMFSDTGSGGKFWPEMLQTKYVSNWKVFQSAFDKRGMKSTALGDIPVSYGINANVLKQSDKWDGNFSKLEAPSQLIMMAPAMDPMVVSVPTFKGLANQAVSLTVPTAGGKLGTHNGRSQINALYADTHVAMLKYGPATDTQAFSNTAGAADSAGSLRWKPRPSEP